MANPTVSFAEQLLAQFRRWELRGRGWLVFPSAVELEPPFRPFGSYVVVRNPVPDDARQSFWARQPPTPSHSVELFVEPEPGIIEARDTGGLAEFCVLLPDDFDERSKSAEQLLASLRFCEHPVSFELIGTAEDVRLLLACSEDDADHLVSRIAAYAPEATLIRDDTALTERWLDSDHDGLVVDLGLSEEFMRPLGFDHAFDPLPAMIGALGRLRGGEVGIFQVLFTAAKAPWAQNITASVHGDDGEPLALLGEGLSDAAKRKVAKPLFAVRPRIAVKASDHSRRLQILRTVIGAVAPHGISGTNELIALDNKGWPADIQEEDLFLRTAHRVGMLLNAEELAALVHLPDRRVTEPRFKRLSKRSHPAPAIVQTGGTFIGINEHAGTRSEVAIRLPLRLRHTYIIGGTGTGKSTLLLNLILQDIEAGHGVAVLDPHGDLVDEVCMRMPEDRIRDTVLLNPADEEYPIPFNVLLARSELERTLLASDLVAVFRRLSTSWGDQMNAVLANAILAFLESTTGGTLSDLRRFLVEKEYRTDFLKTVQDEEIVYYWQREFPLLSGRPQAPILTRLDTFLRPKLIRRMVSQRDGSLDFRRIMDERRILLCKLAQGAIGEENSYLLGALIVAKLQQAALSRQNTDAASRTPFFIYLDEFQHFVTPSVSDLLTGVRKYALGLTLAHQHLSQLQGRSDTLADAALGAGTRIAFRTSDHDAKSLASGFSHFEAADLLNLSTGEAIVRVERAEFDFNLRTEMLPDLEPEKARSRLAAVFQSSRARHAVRITPDVQETPTTPPEAPRGEPKAATPLEAPRPQPKAAATTPQEPISPPPIKLPPREPGAGGQEHRYLQSLVKGLGEAANLRATLEVPILHGEGRVDVVLERDGFRAAVQITVTTETEHEVSNLSKCLAAGFDVVVLTSSDRRKLKRAETAARKVVSPEAFDRVQFLPPEELPQLISSWAAEQAEEIVSGYKVKVRMSEPAADDAGLTQRIKDMLTRSLKRKR